MLNGAKGAVQVGRTAPVGNALIVTPSVLVFSIDEALKLIPVKVTAVAPGRTVNVAVV